MAKYSATVVALEGPMWSQGEQLDQYDTDSRVHLGVWIERNIDMWLAACPVEGDELPTLEINVVGDRVG